MTIPDVVANRYGSVDALRQAILEGIVTNEYQKGHITIREGANLLELTYEGFMEWLGKRKLPFINASDEELQDSYESFETFMQTYQKT
jgi:predicted HTH domain antitoxin